MRTLLPELLRISARRPCRGAVGASRALIVAIVCLAGAARAGTRLDPFRAAGTAPVSADPFRTAQADAPQTAPAAASSAACREDRNCPAGTICEQGMCRAVEPPVRILLFRKEGGSTAFIPFYWSNVGNPGHRVVAPIYWHFWSPESRTRFVVPFYWHSEDHTRQRTVTVIVPGLPISWTKQPDASSFAVWPLFYKSTKFGWAAPLLGSFTIANPDEGRGYGLLGLLYFWTRNQREERGFDLLFPLLVSKRSHDRAFTWALPLNFYWRNGHGSTADRNWLLLPLVYANEHGDESVAATPIGYVSRSGASQRGSLMWLYWFGRNPNAESGHDVLFPLLWSFRDRDSAFSMFLPLVYAGRNRAAGTSFALVAPLALWRTSDQGRSASLITPVGGYARDAADGSSRLVLLVPPMFHDRRQGRTFDMVAGLYWRYRNDDTGTTTTVLGPWFKHRDVDGETTGLVPLYWSFRDDAARAHARLLFPFFFSRRNGDESTVAGGVFPLWGYHRKFADGGSSSGLFPLAFFGSHAGRRHAVIFPVLFHGSDAEGSTTVIPPLFYRSTSRDAAYAGVPALLYFQGRDRDGSFHVQFPLFWRYHDARSEKTTTVVPPFFVSTKPGGWSAGLAPLLFAGGGREGSHAVLFPLLWYLRDEAKDSTTVAVLPYLHRRIGGETTDALLPLLWYRRGARPGGTDETSFTLFPLVHYRRDATSAVFASPIGAWTRSPQRKAGLLGLYGWYDGPTTSAQGVLPLWLDVTRKDLGSRTRIFGPFFATDDRDGSRARVLFPLFAHFSSPEESATYVFPTLFHQRRGDWTLDAFVPFYWYGRGKDRHTFVLGPFFSHHEGAATSSGLLPLYVWANSPERTKLVTPLWYYGADHKQGTSRLVAALLFYRSTRPDGDSTVLFPLWYSGRTGPRSHRVVFPLYWHFANDDERTSVSVLGPFFATREGSFVRRGLVPIAWYTRDQATGAASHALFPLFYERHGGGDLKILSPVFGYGHSTERKFWYVPPAFDRDSVTNRFSMVAPLWFRYRDKVTQTTTNVVPPLLHVSRSSPDKSLSVWLGLLWRTRSIDSATNLLLPLFFDVHTFHESRTTVLLPLFVRHRQESDGSSWTLAPLFYRRSGPTDATTVLFPFLWSFRSAPDHRTTVLFPFYVGIDRPTYAASYVFPSFWYRRGLGTAAGTSRFMFFPFWESAVKRPGDRMWEVLLGLFGYERIGRNRYMKLFFIPFELEPVPRAQTAWYGRPPRATRPQRDVRAAVW